MIQYNFFLNITNIIINLIDVLLVLLPILLAVAFMTIIERKQLAAHQRRVGPVLCFGKTHEWVKPSNSGDALKLLIPSYSRKAISGQNNYLGMVTSQEMNESEMGYRGSKSEFLMNSVKEQRVDGSWSNYLLNNSFLRYTLMGGESRYQVKIPSKQLNIKKFSTLNSSLPINPWFITGLIDAEGSFSVIIDKNKSRKLGWRVETKFQLGMPLRDI